jgi:2-amino-4-hydroxy-6-hydroxymethyldihydropteridine diphosphokinase
MVHDAYIALGSNLGDRAVNIRGALEAIGALRETQLVASSSIIETQPVGPAGQGPYLNGAAHVRTDLSARELLDALLEIEAQFGRDRSCEQRWGARTLDLDVLIFADQVIDEPGLRVPHPRMHERLFVLLPLCEIAPEIEIPGRKETPRVLLEALHNDDSCK